MDEKLKKEVNVYELLNGLTFIISSFALSVTRMISVHKNYVGLALYFILGIVSFVISPYLILLFKKCKKRLAVASGFLGPSSVIVANILDLSTYNLKFKACLITGMLVLICIAVIRIVEVKRAKKSIRKEREILKSVQVLITAICIFALIVSVPTGIAKNNSLSNKAVDESEIITSSIEATNNADTKDNSFIKAHLKELMPIIDGTYDNLSLAQRLDIFQTIVNIECTYFGSSIAVPVKAMPIPAESGTICAYYYSEEETIYLNELVFNDLDAEDALYIVLHEVYHVYQHEQKKLYESVPDELKGLSTLSSAKECKEGLDNYINSEEDYEEYENQAIEQDANSFAYVTTAEYIELITQYASDENADN